MQNALGAAVVLFQLYNLYLIIVFPETEGYFE